MDTLVVMTLAILIGLGLGAITGYFGRMLLFDRRYEAAKRHSSVMLEEAKETGRSIVIEAREEALKVRSTGDAEIRERRVEQQQVERRLAKREENADNRSSNLERREQQITRNEKIAAEIRKDLDGKHQEELLRLETISQLSMGEAQNELMQRAEEQIQHELAIKYRDMEDVRRNEAEETARNILAGAIHRLASEVVSESTLASVPLPNDDMKGRLIGREGRNIRAIEKATGVDLLIDETPEMVTLSCFDPIRREVARLAVGKLITDGRIHPARIEEMVAKSEKDVDETIRKTGEQAVLDVGVRGLSPDLIRLIGRLKYRFSYGENVLQHSIEVANLASLIASEIGGNVKIAKTGGLLHDIGKALTHEIEGPHAEIGADVAVKNNVSQDICATIREHHDDDHSTVESFIVSASDAISAARPGSRRDTVEHYVKRLEALEEVGKAFDGVEKCFAIQAGREMRVMVQPQTIDDLAADKMARDIVKKIEETLVYPGQIKVTVIRESRSVEFAR